MEKKCEKCNKIFTARNSTYKYCSKECSSRLHIKKICKCLNCSIEFETYQIKLFCNTRCGLQYRNKKAGFKVTGKTKKEIQLESIKKRTFICKGCGKKHIAKHADRTTYCSRECSDTHLRIKQIDNAKPKFTKIYLIKCNECNKLFYSNRINSKYCSDNCKTEGVLREGRYRSKLYAQNKYKLNPNTQDCISCGVAFTALYTVKDKLCSDECKKEQRKKWNRISSNHRRRAKYYGVKYETVKPNAIFNRDDWTCQTCGCTTPKELRGKQEDNSPELDHVIPISLGGDHAHTNIQCLCRVCNILKGAMSNDSFIQSMQRV